MSVWINEDAKVIVQGITGNQGQFHSTKMAEYGTDIVGGCTPGKGGQTIDLGVREVPVWDSVEDAINEFIKAYRDRAPESWIGNYWGDAIQ